MSHIEITGNLAADPEFAHGKESGRPYARLQVVVNYRQKNADGSWSDGGKVGYRVTVFDRVAENVADSLHTGDRVNVSGEYVLRAFQGNDGTTGHSHEIRNATVGIALDYATATITRNPKATSEQGE